MRLLPSWKNSFGGDVIYIVKNGYALSPGLRITQRKPRPSGVPLGDSDPVGLSMVGSRLSKWESSPDETVLGFLNPLGPGFPSLDEFSGYLWIYRVIQGLEDSQSPSGSPAGCPGYLTRLLTRFLAGFCTLRSCQTGMRSLPS